MHHLMGDAPIKLSLLVSGSPSVGGKLHHWYLCVPEM